MELDIDRDWIRVTNNNWELRCEETVFGKWHHVVWWTGTSVLEHNASIFRYNKALSPDYVLFIQDYHKLEYMLLRGYYNGVYCIALQLFLYRSGFLWKWIRDNSFSFLKMYIFSLTVWIGNSITYKENSGLSHCSLKGCRHRSRVGMHKLHEMITDLKDKCLHIKWVLCLNDYILGDVGYWLCH